MNPTLTILLGFSLSLIIAIVIAVKGVLSVD